MFSHVVSWCAESLTEVRFLGLPGGSESGPKFRSSSQSADEEHHGSGIKEGAGALGDREPVRCREGPHGPAEALDRNRLYNVANLSFAWSATVNCAVLRVRPRRSVSRSAFTPHPRPGAGPATDGGAHGPAGSPSAPAERLVRSHKARPTAPHRDLCQARPRDPAAQPAAEQGRTTSTDSSRADDTERRT